MNVHSLSWPPFTITAATNATTAYQTVRDHRDKWRERESTPANVYLAFIACRITQHICKHSDRVDTEHGYMCMVLSLCYASMSVTVNVCVWVRVIKSTAYTNIHQLISFVANHMCTQGVNFGNLGGARQISDKKR